MFPGASSEKQADEKKHNVKNPKQVKRHRETQRERERDLIL